MADDDPFYQREAEKYDTPIASREFILDYIKKCATPVDFEQLATHFSVDDSDTQTEALRRRLRAMERDGQVIYTRKRCYALPDKLSMIRGKVIGHADGFGFLRPEEGGKDYFLSPREMKKVAHGDTILAQIIGEDNRGKKELRFIRILEPRSSELMGRYFVDHNIGLVIPDDKRIPWEILIPEGANAGARHGQVVRVTVSQRGGPRQNALGEVLEVLGDQMEPGMEIQIALREHDIPHTWPDAVIQQSKKFTEVVPEAAKKGRVDLREIPLVTIDGSDARDFDDAVYCERKRSGGWRLWVAIADVAYYVTLKSALDLEAANRGNSVYFPGEVIPMLPEILSNGLCSLNPHVDRLCMVCEMTISEAGNLSGYQFYEGVMNSHARLTYERVAGMLDGNFKPTSEEKPLLPHLHDLEAMYEAMQRARHKRGAIEFETEETQFIFNAQRKIEQILPRVRNKAHKMIEECMIAANVSAARWVEKNKASALFRVHDTPSEEKISLLHKFLSELGLALHGGMKPTPRDFAQITRDIADRPDAELIQTMLLRSMRQAVYQPDNVGHFGLALKSYAHFTSPIRRYPDLILHRTLKALIHGDGNKQTLAHSQARTGGHFYRDEDLDKHAEHCSVCERRADEATRNVNDWLKCEFMQDHVGGVFSGIISSVTNFGFFARLDNLHIDGLVHVSQLRNDYYQFDPQHQQLIGEHTRKRYRVGDKVEIRVLSVRLDDKKIDFGLTQTELKPVSRKSKTAKAAQTNSTGSEKKRTSKSGKAGSKKAGRKKTDSKTTGSQAAKPQKLARKKTKKASVKAGKPANKSKAKKRPPRTRK